LRNYSSGLQQSSAKESNLGLMPADARKYDSRNHPANSKSGHGAYIQQQYGQISKYYPGYICAERSQNNQANYTQTPKGSLTGI